MTGNDTRAAPARPGTATDGWPEHPGVGGLNPAALRSRSRDHSPERAREAVQRWRQRVTRAATDTGELGTFPFREILDHYQSEGRIYADRGLAADLRRIHELLHETQLRYARPGWLLPGWLPSTFDQDDGDYESFLGKRLLDRLHQAQAAVSHPSGEPAVETSIDGLVGALVADTVQTEAAALLAVPDDRWQRRRTYAAVQALLHAAPLAPKAGLGGSHLEEVRTSLTAGPDTPGLAAIAGRAAAATQVLVPEPVRRVVEVTMLPITRLHDELMFLRCVQIFESLYEQVVRRIGRATDQLQRGELTAACDELTDATGRLRATPALYRVLTTMPREVFAVIRGLTDGRSANQSRPYRRVELMGAPAPPGDAPAGATNLCVPGPTLQEVFAAQLNRLGAARTRPVAEAMRWLDAAWCAMKRTHWGITLKIIGEVPGTGGTSGASYLKTAADRPLFPQLARERPAAAKER